MLGNPKTYYIQSKPPTRGVFVHHACYTALKKITLNHGSLQEGKPYKGISLTTDPGRFISHIPGFASTVDGFIEFPVENLIEENYVLPCLYRTTQEIAEAAKGQGYTVFEEVPPEYKYILRYVVHNDIFLGENEWVHLGPHLNLAWSDYKVYIARKFFKRFTNSIPASATYVPRNRIFCMEDHPLRKP